MNFPLSKSELEAVRAIREKVTEKSTGFFSEQEYQQWQDILSLMIDRNVLFMKEHVVILRNKYGMPIVGKEIGKDYCLRGNFDIFENWLMIQHKKAKSLSRREWTISFVSMILGAIITNISSIIRWFKSL